MSAAWAMVGDAVWVFVGEGRFPAGVFHSVGEAEAWIVRESLTGCLTEYPVGIGVLDWAMADGGFVPKPGQRADPRWVGSFSSARARHHHDEDGVRHAWRCVI